MKLEFGPFAILTERRALLRDGESLSISPKAYSLLVALAERRPSAVSKDELLELLWPDATVAESNIPVLIHELRTALGEAGRSAHWVRTIHGYGYAFEAIDSESTAERPVVLFQTESDRRPLPEGEFAVGRDDRSAIHIDDSTVSRKHATVTIGRRRIRVRDDGSKNGTRVRGNLVETDTTVHAGDAVAFGRVLTTFTWISREDDTQSWDFRNQGE